jgi:hypothetical protein
MKKALELLWVNIKAWLLAVASNLWEDYLKQELKSQIDTLIIRGVNLAHAYHGSDDYKKKKGAVFDFIFKNIQLPFILKPFKGLIRAILSNSIEKQIDKAFNAADNLVDKLV